jgi:comEA protein
MTRGLIFRRSLILFAIASFLFPAVATANKKKPPDHPINLNTATSAELQEVPGIGPVTADKILKMRKLRGPFKSVNELRAIKGIGPKRLAKMKPYLTVGDAPGKKAPGQAKPPD